MKNMKKSSPLKDLCPEKNLTNQSVRKTVVKKLKSSGIPKCGKLKGHASANGLDDYDSGDERERQIISPLTTVVPFLQESLKINFILQIPLHLCVLPAMQRHLGHRLE